jgi:hypothetical protein
MGAFAPMSQNAGSQTLPVPITYFSLNQTDILHVLMSLYYQVSKGDF